MNYELYDDIIIPSKLLASYLDSRDAHLAGSLAHELVGSLGRISGSKPAQQEEEGQNNKSDDRDLAQDRSAVAELGPLTASLTSVVLDLFVAELVVDHASQSNAVAEELQTGDNSAPDKHGCGNQHNVLEHSANGEYQGRGLANL